MYRLYNVHDHETYTIQFLDYENAREEAHLWSKDTIGGVVIIDTENGTILSIWNDGECSYEV